MCLLKGKAKKLMYPFLRRKGVWGVKVYLHSFVTLVMHVVGLLTSCPHLYHLNEI
jgi:hypothetical protein